MIFIAYSQSKSDLLSVSFFGDLTFYLNTTQVPGDVTGYRYIHPKLITYGPTRPALK